MMRGVLRRVIGTTIIMTALAGSASSAVAQRTQPRIVPTPGDPRIIDATSALPLIGELAPRFKVELIDGRAVTADSLVGAPHVIAIWSTDCPGSRAALAGMESLHDELSGHGVRFLLMAPIPADQHSRSFSQSVTSESQSLR
jgi:hypothetical protein